MKKILLATSILAGFAGAAAAEVTLSGDARMGIAYNGSDAAFTSRARVTFTMSGTTDGGLEFGAKFRADKATAAVDDIWAGDTSMDSGTVYISGAFGKLSMGDNDNAANTLVGNVSGVGLTGLGDLNELGYLGHDKTNVLYTYSAGAVSFALSAGQVGSDDYSAAVKYSTDQFSVALGYEDVGGGNNQTTLGGSATFGAATVKAVIEDWSGSSDLGYALSVDYVTGAATVTAFYADHDGFYNAYGIGASYDLGGGASVVGGLAKREGFDAIADIGVSMSF